MRLPGLGTKVSRSAPLMKSSKLAPPAATRRPIRSPTHRLLKEVFLLLASSQFSTLRHTQFSEKSATHERGHSSATVTISSSLSGSVAVTPTPKSFRPSPMSSPSSSSRTSRYEEPSAATASGASPMTTTSSSATRRMHAPCRRTSTPAPLKCSLKRHWTSTRSSGARRVTSARNCLECGIVTCDVRRHASHQAPRRGARGARACGGTKTDRSAQSPGSRTRPCRLRATHASGQSICRSAVWERTSAQTSSVRLPRRCSVSTSASPSSGRSSGRLGGASGRNASVGDGGACRWKPT
mmetsp:Transcript_94944/g.245192  ORF Transcript_94944/g.245192 Transcript_94944/m.245192 type:complete len:296 (+) Transcript_94944:179-1066(+)